MVRRGHGQLPQVGLARRSPRPSPVTTEPTVVSSSVMVAVVAMMAMVVAAAAADPVAARRQAVQARLSQVRECPVKQFSLYVGSKNALS